MYASFLALMAMVSLTALVLGLRISPRFI
jgi:hypothetical protein